MLSMPTPSRANGLGGKRRIRGSIIFDRRIIRQGYGTGLLLPGRAAPKLNTITPESGIFLHLQPLAE